MRDSAGVPSSLLIRSASMRCAGCTKVASLLRQKISFSRLSASSSWDGSNFHDFG